MNVGEPNVPTTTLLGLPVPLTMSSERHSNLKSDPKSNLGALRPTNEEAEKEKFKNYWVHFATKNKVYNPRFNYVNP